MRGFNLNKKYNIVCNTADTRSGFKHIATLHSNGYSIGQAKINYYNRTWERFEFEDVLKKTVKSFFEGKEQEKYLKVIEKITY